jgi:hypothetical protein
VKQLIIRIIGIIIIVIFILQCNGNIPMTKNYVAGMYINKNYEKKHCCVESPHKPDTLILKPDGTLSSNYFGIGTYKVDYRIVDIQIELNYENETGKHRDYTYFVNRIFEKPKIIMNSDTNHYFEKKE